MLRRMKFARRVGTLVSTACCAVVLSGCGAPQPPRCGLLRMPVLLQSPAPALAQARDAWHTLATNRDPAAVAAATATYNQAVARLFRQMRCDARSWQDSATAIGTVFPSQSVAGIPLEHVTAIFPAADVDTRKVGERHTREGAGVPLVAWIPGRKLDSGVFPFAPSDGVPLSLTAVLRFEQGRTPEWRLEPTREQATIRVGARDLDLAADWSAGNAFFWHMSDLDDLDLRNVFLPERFYERAKIYCPAPYDPDKIPVVFVHGLKSSPAAFRKLTNRLAVEPWFRSRYQAWFFAYPTGTPWTYNAKIFRDEIQRATEHARTKGSLENWDKMVLVAHSMGGLISRASVSEPGTAFYDAWFDVPVDQLKGRGESVRLVRQMALYQPLAEPGRVIFMAVPHRGAPMADRFFSNWINKLIRLPKTLTIDLLDVTLSNVANTLSPDEARKGLPTSISSLSPQDKSVQALQKMPFRPGIRRHSVIGDRGKGNTPDSSDGVVPYWSSHLNPVESEAIIPYHHGVPDHPAAAAEVKRILKLHLAN